MVPKTTKLASTRRTLVGIHLSITKSSLSVWNVGGSLVMRIISVRLRLSGRIGGVGTVGLLV